MKKAKIYLSLMVLFIVFITTLSIWGRDSTPFLTLSSIVSMVIAIVSLIFLLVIYVSEAFLKIINQKLNIINIVEFVCTFDMLLNMINGSHDKRDLTRFIVVLIIVFGLYCWRGLFLKDER